MLYQPSGYEFWKAENAKRNFALTPETHRIVFSWPDGTVGIVEPNHEYLYYMTGHGGAWNDYPIGFVRDLVRRKTCPILQRGHPCTKEAAERFVKAASWGGRSVEEAWEILKGIDAEPFGNLIEIHAIEDIPSDRTYRDAWRRSANGGPIYVDEALARAIDEQRKAA